MSKLGRHLDSDPLALDQGTAERLLAGTVDPADAPPAYAAVAEVLAAAAGPPQPDELIGQLQAAMGKSRRLDRAFIVQLTQRLRDQDPEVWPALDWVEEQLASEATTTEQIVHVEHQRQAAAQATVGNIITSMRLLSTLDWKVYGDSYHIG